MCHAEEQWAEFLPLVLLGIRTVYKEDLQSSAEELVYGKPLRIPGEVLVPADPKVEASTFIQQLRRRMDQGRPTPAALHASPATFIHKDLRDSTHVFLRQDAIRRALEPPYSGPHKVIARTDKTQLSCAAGTSHYISGPSKASLHIERDSTRHRQPISPAPQRSSETCYHDDSTSNDYTLKAHCTLPDSVHQLSPLLGEGWCWDTHIVAPQYRKLPHPTLPGMYVIPIYNPNPYTNPSLNNNNNNNNPPR